MADAVKNFYASLVAGGGVIGSNSGTTLQLSAGDGAKAPATPFNIVVWPNVVRPTSANAEIMRVTAIVTDTCTVTRAQESTTALSTISAGYQVQQAPTGKMFSDAYAVRAATATVGPSGSYADNIGNGTSDDVAINAALTSTQGQRIVRAGTYQVTQHILPLTGHVLSGEGYATQLILAATKVIKVDQQNNVVIRDLYLDPSANSSTNSYAIYIDRSNDVTVRDVFINQTFAYGVFITNQTAGTTVSRFRVLNCRIIGKCNNDLVGGGPGTATSNVTDLLIQGNFLMQDATLSGAGTYLNAIDVVAQQKSDILGNTTYGSILLGGEKIPHFNCNIVGNIVNPPNGIASNLSVGQIAVLCASNAGQSVDSYGINIAANQITSGNIFIQGQSSTSNRTRKVVISGNNIGGTKVATWTDHNYGINLQYLADVKVENNIVDGSTNGIYLSNCQNIDISNNTFLNCTTAAAIGTACTGVTGHNNVGINPDVLYAQGSVTGATTFDRTNGVHITATQTGDITVTMPSTFFIGELLTLEIVTGGHAQTWPANFKIAGGSLAMTGTSTVTARWDGTNWVEVSRSLNIS